MSSVFDDQGEIVPDLGPTKNENDSVETSASKIFLSSSKFKSGFLEARI